jgi:formylglycine-generating enzyme required for sulfatase activity
MRTCGAIVLLGACCAPNAGRLSAVGAQVPADVGSQVLVPGGSFIAGCDETEPACPTFAQPRRIEVLPTFRIDRYEVTEPEYLECVREGVCASERTVSTDGMAMEVATIAGARDYCGWRGMRLPTHLEWEKAARGVDGRRYPWGSEAPTCKLASYCASRSHDEIFLSPLFVGRHPAGQSPYGVEDMAGNAPEWTECPPSAEACTGMVRGGNLSGDDGLLTYRADFVSGDYRLGAGFRCVR